MRGVGIQAGSDLAGVAPCPTCSNYRFAAESGRCLTCHAHEEVFSKLSGNTPVKPRKTPPPRVTAGGKLLAVKPTGKSRAPDALRREQMYREAMGLRGDDDSSNPEHA